MGLKSVASVVCLTAAAVIIGCSANSKTVKPDPDVPLESVDPKIVFHADTDFSDWEKFQLEDAAKIWSVQTSGQADIKIVYDLDFSQVSVLKQAQSEGWNVLLKMDSSYPSVHAADCDHDPQCRPKVLGWTTSGGIHNPEGAPVVLALIVDRSGDRLKQVALHEFGHALGLTHSGSPAAMMYPAIIPAAHVCLRQPDLQLFCQANRCTKPLYPCEG